MNEEPRVAIFCVGNRLMLDDGLGPAVYDALLERYELPPNVDAFDLGCLSLAQVEAVRNYDAIITVDAVDGTGEPPGTVFRIAPEEMARRAPGSVSLHDLKLIDLFDAAVLLGYEAQGVCLGMQVENASPALVTEGLTPRVHERLGFLVEVLVGELHRFGACVCPRCEP